jgi:hypothetical protein
MLASDLNNPEFANPTDPDARLHVVFYMKPIKNEFKSTVENRPIFEDTVFVRIHIPGDQLSVIDCPAREDHKVRFPRHWALFDRTQGKDGQEIGTPLSQWPLLSPAVVESLLAMKFRTVEQVAGASDQNIDRIGMLAGMSPYALREKAQRYLLVARDTSIVDSAKEELEKIKREQAERDAKHAQDLADMQRKLDAVLAMASVPKKRGRPPKQKTEELTGP